MLGESTISGCRHVGFITRTDIVILLTVFRSFHLPPPPACCLWNFIIAGTLKAFGVIYLELLELYGKSPSETAWVGFAFSIMNMILCKSCKMTGSSLMILALR